MDQFGTLDFHILQAMITHTQEARREKAGGSTWRQVSAWVLQFIHPACNTLCLFNMFRCKGLGEVSRWDSWLKHLKVYHLNATPMNSRRKWQAVNQLIIGNFRRGDFKKCKPCPCVYQLVSAQFRDSMTGHQSLSKRTALTCDMLSFSLLVFEPTHIHLAVVTPRTPRTSVADPRLIDVDMEWPSPVKWVSWVSWVHLKPSGEKSGDLPLMKSLIKSWFIIVHGVPCVSGLDMSWLSHHSTKDFKSLPCSHRLPMTANLALAAICIKAQDTKTMEAPEQPLDLYRCEKMCDVWQSQRRCIRQLLISSRWTEEMRIRSRALWCIFT